jgi:DNA-binding MarR family transcriptional regulator
MEATWIAFAAAVETEPTTRTARGLLDRILSAALAVLRRGSRGDLQSLARRADRFARGFAPAPDASPEVWQCWYAGQAHVLAAVCRLALVDDVSNEVMRLIRGRAHAQRVLLALRHREIGVTALASELGIDISQLGKLIDKLEEHDLVETHKNDRTRWVRLTALGERAATADADLPNTRAAEQIRVVALEVGAESKEISPEYINELTSVMEHVNERMERVTANHDALQRFISVSQRYADLARQIESAASQASRVAPEAPVAAVSPYQQARV